MKSSAVTFSKEFSERVRGAYGKAGTEWLNRLPDLIASAADRWTLQIRPAFTGISYNYVAPAVTAEGELFVIKSGVPGAEFSSEVAALTHFAGLGSARVIEADAEDGIMLLEHLSPGRPLAEMKNDDVATSIFAQIVRLLRKPLPEGHGFPAVSDWSKGFGRLRSRFDGDSGPFPRPTLDRAERVMSELLASTTHQRVLHGDLHHWNILSAERQPWLAVDPQGVVGECEYEVGAWLRNPFPHILEMPNPKKTLTRRVSILAEELSHDPQRLMAWGYSQAVLAAVWSLEEGSSEWKEWLRCAEIFSV